MFVDAKVCIKNQTNNTFFVFLSKIFLFLCIFVKVKTLEKTEKATKKDDISTVLRVL